MGKTIGIDLGTTNSCVAYMEGAEAKVVPSAGGARTTPSVVAFGNGGNRILGHTAKRQIITNPKKTFFSIKRLIGRKYDSPVIRELLPKLPFEIVPAENRDVRLKFEETILAPQEISAYLLMHLKENAEEYLDEPVDTAVITVPANFDDSQRQATKDAATIAGLKVARIINEPTAACLAYGFHHKKEGKVFVYDFGGGTFDVSILEIGEGVFKVLSTRGDSFLGGNDFDRRIVDWILKLFQEKNGIDLSNDPFVYQRVLEVAEKAKMELSFVQETEINLPYVYVDDKGPKHIVMTLTRGVLEELTEDLVERTVPYIQEALDGAKIRKDEINDVILVGGQTRMPLIKDHLKRFFGHDLRADINPDEVVAMGAAVQSAILQGEIKDIVLLDVTPLSLGIETKGDSFTRIIPMNSTIPIKKQKTFTTVVDNQSVVKIHILQGEREIASENRSLGYFELVDIAPAPKGMPQIIVTFEIDADGIVQVSAKDKASGYEQKIRINPSSGLSSEEIRRMVAEADKFKENDIQKKNLNREVSALTTLLDSISHSFNNLKERIAVEKRSPFEDFFSQGRSALERPDLELIKRLRTEGEMLQEKLYEIINEIYSKGAPVQAPSDPVTIGDDTEPIEKEP